MRVTRRGKIIVFRKVEHDVWWTAILPTIQLQSFVLVVFLGVCCICAQDATGQGQLSETPQNRIRGTVVNSVTHAPIGRALVYSPDNRFATLTDSEGHFEFKLPKNGSDSEGGSVVAGPPQQMSSVGRDLVSLIARKPGFLDDPNQGRQVESPSTGEITISLVPEALIKGRVTGPGTEAAFGLEVQIYSRLVQDGLPRWVPGSSVRTNSNGEFRFAELPPGTYKLFTHELMDDDPANAVPGGQLYGFPPVYTPGVADFAAAGTIQLTAGQTFQADVSLLRQAYYPVRIPVLAADPNEGMNVTVSLQGHRGPGYSLGYNAENHAIEGLLPNGNYVVDATTFGPMSSAGVVTISVAGGAVEGPKMVLTANAAIRLSVVEEFMATDWHGTATWNVGKRSFTVHGPRAYLQVGIEPVDDFEPRRYAGIRPPTGPNDTSLLIESLPPGRYWLRLRSSRGYVASATVGGVDLLHEPLLVAPGSNDPIEITMRDDGAEIEGNVASGIEISRSSPLAPAPPAYVICVPLTGSSGQFQEVWVDEKFNLLMLAPGTYRVLAFSSPQPSLPYRDREAMRAYETKGQIVHLAPGQKQNLQLQVISGSE